MAAPVTPAARRTVQRDSRLVNELIKQRFAESSYANWAPDRKREWRTRVANELNARATELDTHSSWDADGIQRKLSSLDIRVRTPAPARQATATPTAVRALSPLSLSMSPPRPLCLASTPLVFVDTHTHVSNNTDDNIECIDDDDDDNDGDGDGAFAADTWDDVHAVLSNINADDNNNNNNNNTVLPTHSCGAGDSGAVADRVTTVARTLRDYFVTEQAALLANARRVSRTYHHRGLRGSGVEELVLEFLRSHCSNSTVHVGSGELLLAERRQLDCVLYDARVPSLGGRSTQRVFFAESVVAVVEVKSHLTTHEYDVSLSAAVALAAARVPYFVLALDAQLSLTTIADRWARTADTSHVCGIYVLSEGCVQASDTDATTAITRDDEHCTLGQFYAALFERVQRRTASAASPVDVRRML